MKHFFTLLGDLLFYAFTHALSENWLDVLNWTNLTELLYEIEDEFGFKIPWDEMRKLDGTFDAIVRYVASQRRPTS